VPARRFGLRWELELSTGEPGLEPEARSFAARDEITLEPRSIVVLRRS
jgi:hypothetical protein